MKIAIIALITVFVILAAVSIFFLIQEKKEKSEKNNKKIVKAKRSKDEDYELPHYNCYKMSKIEFILWAAVGFIGAFSIGFLCYRNIIWSFIVGLSGFVYPKFKTESIINARKDKLTSEFKEALYAISSSLTAGKSVPLAFKEAYEDLSNMYEGKNMMILEELQFINRRLERNETIEEALIDFAERSALDDVQSFADIFNACTRTGGNLKEVIQKSSDIISEKIEIKQEINTMVSSKKLEGRVLVLIPIGILLFLEVSAKDFIAPMFTTMGRIIMTIAMVVIFLAQLWARKITNIEV